MPTEYFSPWHATIRCFFQCDEALLAKFPATGFPYPGAKARGNGRRTDLLENHELLIELARESIRIQEIGSREENEGPIINETPREEGAFSYSAGMLDVRRRMRDGNELEGCLPRFQIRRSATDEIHDEVARVPVVRGRQFEYEFAIGGRTVCRYAYGSGMLGGGIVDVSVRSVEVSGRLGVDLRVRIEVESLEFQILYITFAVVQHTQFVTQMEGCRRI